ncbi:cytochrome P450 [Thelephora ganbajun]|uniref:Cytochrome P450 n=1 Tax=Thelephora ganbajun TaxID=370292 RepID=A0ACB6ZWU1_THEGA|nr:cytochrome P450 [Thelephora ganbajun]
MAELVLCFFATTLKLLFAFLVALAFKGALWVLNLFILAPLSDPLRRLPGPTAGYWENHFWELIDPNQSPKTHDVWTRRYGKTWRFHGFGAFDLRLVTFDSRAVDHVLNSPNYEKPWQTQRFLSRLIGQGVFAKEGQEHRWQRRILAPAFNSAALKEMYPIFVQKAEELRDRWDNIIGPSSSIPYPTPPSTPPPGERESDTVDFSSTKNTSPETIIDVCDWMNRATLDVIGLAGFSYSFNSLTNKCEEVCSAYREMLQAAEKPPGFKELFALWFPIIEDILPDAATRAIRHSRKVINDAGHRIVTTKREDILAKTHQIDYAPERDILSLLIKSNMSEDYTRRMTDEELMDQISTLLFAGSDTTSLAISWCLHHLSLNPRIQERLKEELQLLHSIEDMTLVDKLPYLNAVVQETLRLCPPAHSTIRVAMEDDIIPLSYPIRLRGGAVTQEVHIRKGSYVHIPIEGLNMSKDIWGKDALTFDPDRWMCPGRLPARHLGLADVMSFSQGPSSCIGWRFAILEMKVFISTVVRYFNFAPVAEIRRFNTVVTRPYVKDRLENGAQLPIKISRSHDRL